MNDQIMRGAGFGKEMDRMKKGCCPFCGKRVSKDAFRSEEARKEFLISGMCQACQDGFYADPRGRVEM